MHKRRTMNKVSTHKKICLYQFKHDKSVPAPEQMLFYMSKNYKPIEMVNTSSNTLHKEYRSLQQLLLVTLSKHRVQIRMDHQTPLERTPVLN